MHGEGAPVRIISAESVSECIFCEIGWLLDSGKLWSPWFGNPITVLPFFVTKASG